MFWKYTSDFEKISQAVVACGGSVSVAGDKTLLRECCRFLQTFASRRISVFVNHGRMAAKHGVLPKHMELIRDLV